MAYPGTLDEVGFKDGVFRDAFGRLRVSEPLSLFDGKLLRGKEPLHWAEKLDNGATSAHQPNRASVLLTAGVDTAKAVRQTRRRMVYQPGKSFLHLITFVMGSAEVNIRRRVGFFDDKNGIFLEQTSSGVRFVVRSYVTGAAADTNFAAQGDWNGDKLDGNGESGITLDLAKAQILWIDMEWLSVGRVRAGFVIDGQFILCHEFNHANNITSAYMTNPNLPIRYEIEATGVPGGDGQMECICCSVQSEGGYHPTGIGGSADRGITPMITDEAPRELIAIRIKPSHTAFSTIKVAFMDVISPTDAYGAWALVINPTGLTAGTWVSAGDNSCVEYNITRGNEPLNGHKLISGYFTREADGASLLADLDYWLGSNVAGEGDVISLVVRRAVAGGNESWLGSLGWTESY